MADRSPAGPPAELLVGERSVDLHLGPALGEPFLFASLAKRGEVGRLAVEVECRVVRVLFVEDEGVRVLRGSVGAIDEATGLRFPDRGQRVALTLRRPDLHD